MPAAAETARVSSPSAKAASEATAWASEASSGEAAASAVQGGAQLATCERGDVSLDAAISAFERGTELKTLCQARLEEARMKVEKIKVPEASSPPRDASAFDADET